MTRASQLNGVIRSERLLIEPLLGAHAELLFESMSEPRLYRWISAQPPASRELLRKRWDAASSGVPAAHAKLNLNWAVQLVSDGAYVGKLDAQIGASEVGHSAIGASDLVTTGDVATNVGYIVFFPFWNQGYATEAVRALASHLERHGIVEQRALVTRGNDASARVLIKAGFVETRVLPDNDTIRGEKYDDLEYVRRAGARLAPC